MYSRLSFTKLVLNLYLRHCGFQRYQEILPSQSGPELQLCYMAEIRLHIYAQDADVVAYTEC